MTTATATSTIQVDFPEPFHPNWSRIDGVHVTGTTVTIDPQRYFFRYEDPSWLLVDWNLVQAELLPLRDSAEMAIEQRALEFVREHGVRTTDPARVLRTGYQVASLLFRDEYLREVSLDITPRQLKALPEATTLMSLNKVELDGRLANVGPCWFFPVATSVVFDLDEAAGRALDELYHGAWFNEYRRRESLLAHAALGGRLVHGCQAAVDMRGGCVLPYGADLDAFRSELDSAQADQWMRRVAAMGRS